MDNEDGNIENIDFLAEAERHQLLIDFNDTKVDYPKDKTIVDLFEEQVQKTPDNVAVVFEEQELTYKELNEQSNQLGDYLRQNYHIQPDDLVAIKLDRSEKMIVAILGILKSGAAYVPLDPEYPQERIAYIEQDTKAKVLIDEDFFIEFEKEKYSKFNLTKINTPENLAYIIYTSGTTGQPKGVMIQINSVVNYVESFTNYFEITSQDSILNLSTIAFDTSIEEIFPILLQGGKLCVVKNNKNFDTLLEICIDKSITRLSTNPYIIEYLNSIHSDVTGSLKLKTIISGGDKLNFNQINNLSSTVELYNTYGPTESTVCISYYHIDKEKTKILIGRPISNTQVYILDEALRPVPIGVSGKLYVSGVGLAQGYLNKPELTSEKFISNPFEKGTRMYDTGDLVRWLPDGNIEFLGRNDFQVKIRGYRIELGEIETHLSQYSDAIKQVVTYAKDVNGEKVLVAYYTIDKGSTIDKTALRQYLQSKLPEYMVPGFFVELESIPLTPNGKIDRKSLPEVTGEDIIRKEYVAPRNETEQKLVEIWQEVLGVEKVGITDNFFELGGHSLMVAQVLNRMYQQLSQNVTFKEFFAVPTIVGISKKLQIEEYFPIPKALDQDSYPLTASQQRLWVLSQLEGGSQAYNMPVVVFLEGILDKVNLDKAFRFLIEKHEILRTSFKVDTQSGEVRQYILPQEEVIFNIDILDFSSKDEQAIDNYLQSINSESFNLEKAPLLRTSLMQIEKDKYLFFLSMHHIVGDGWSIEILISEIVDTYNLLCSGKEPDENPLRIQYKDYTIWLQKEIINERYKKAETYWLQQFEEKLPSLELPNYKTRPLVQTYNGDNVSWQFSESFTKRLKTFSKKHDSTLFMTLMVGIKALLYKYTGQHDIIVGIPIAGREHPDLENQIGLYLNTLAIRNRFEEQNSFKSLLEKEKKLLSEAYEHQRYPFDDLVGKLNLRRNAGRSAVFDIFVILQNQNSLYLGSKIKDVIGLKVKEYDFRRKTSQFDVSYMFVEEGNQLKLMIEYNTNIYDEFLISRMFAHFENLLSKAMDNEDDNIENIDFLTEAERHQLLIDFNDTKVDYPKDKTIIDLFEEQVQKTPDNVAVVFEEQELTYKELNEQANQLGDYLRQNYHIQPDDLIAIKLDRSEKMIVAILGILKSGAAYVPMDPEYPQERIAYIEQDTKAKALIDEDFLIKFEKEKEKYSKVNLPKINSPENLAYIIYTSGTTGQPKGVMIENKSVINVIEALKEAYDFEGHSKITAFTSYTFDVSVSEFFTSLLRGGELHLIGNSLKTDAVALGQYLLNNKIEYTYLPPVILSNLPDYDYSTLRAILYAGEPCTATTGKYWSAKKRLYNYYGPTESTIYVTGKQIVDGDVHLIGCPISNTQAYILDEELRLVPIGVAGKLYVAGTGLARGYLNKPELTYEKFITNPFEEGTKMYDTGDLAKWLPNGNIEFLGRNDFQIKIRGYRIELGEIEIHLSQYSDSIKQVVAEVKEVNGEKVLVAYYTINQGGTIDKTALRQYLQSKLPEYMVPGFFVEMESIPLTPNGKIDRKSLPGITGEDIIRKAYVAPRNETEQKLTEIWQEVLGIEKVGITDNFFELGGHSLIGIKMVHRINEYFQIQINVNQIFEMLTIKQLGELINTIILTKNLSSSIDDEIETESFII
jgi:amino acid adenylation domain-containing protein